MESLKLALNPNRRECGVDEAGRGALAGPVVAAAVIWSPTLPAPHVRDSKTLSKSKREELAEFIKANALAYSVAFIDNQRIDEVNILNATYEAMHKAIGSLPPNSFDHILVDGNRFRPYAELPHTCIVKGDDEFVSIAAASIIAKVTRDEHMSMLSKRVHDDFGWSKNSGYGTSKHISALKTHGPSDFHRKTFAPMKV